MVGVEPKRVPVADARGVLEADGAVVVTGCEGDPEGLVALAAATLGSRLRQLFPIRPQHGADRPALDLHCDGADVVVDIHGRLTRLRDPDEDYLFVLCTAPARSGGDSIVVDGYALVDAVATERPELHAFLTGCDVDYFGGWDTRGREVPSTPLVRRLVEYTRGGRRVVRASHYARPVPREPRWDDHVRLLGEYADVLAAAQAHAPRFVLEAGETLVLDNYRFLHGREAFTGPRAAHVLTVRSSDAW